MEDYGGRQRVVTGGGRGSSAKKRKLDSMPEDAGMSMEATGGRVLESVQEEPMPPTTKPSPEETTLMNAADTSVLQDSVLFMKRTTGKRKKRESIGQNSVRTRLPTSDTVSLVVLPPSVSTANQQQKKESTVLDNESNASAEQRLAPAQDERPAKTKKRSIDQSGNYRK